MLDEPVKVFIDDKPHRGWVIKSSCTFFDVHEYVEKCAAKVLEIFLDSKEPIERLNHDLYLLHGASKAIGSLCLTRMNLGGTDLRTEIIVAKNLYLRTLLQSLSKGQNVLININGGITPFNYEISNI